MTIVNLTVNKVGPFWRVARLLPEFDFLAVGGGYGHQVIPRRLPRNVTLQQHVTEDQMEVLVWARTAMLLVPSRLETWGMTANEALQRGIPVLAHPTAGLVESLGNAGLYADRDRPGDWVYTIRRLLSDGPAYWRRSELCRRRACELTRQSQAQLDRFVSEIEGVVHV